ncbi:unnamed protein product [Cuscuta epithymum]|uniref:Uncharacterized protein n=1 Tax=Cuscuta epithymum TaxID=186058 RepID=A0AAV0C687_9ASTE|nr:unnamed protein product [Cuscuta epithymum]
MDRYWLAMQILDKTGVLETTLFTSEVHKLLSFIMTTNFHPDSVDCVELNDTIKDLTFVTSEVHKLLSFIMTTNFHPDSVDCVELNDTIKDLTSVTAIKVIVKQYQGELKTHIVVLSL